MSPVKRIALGCLLTIAVTLAGSAVVVYTVVHRVASAISQINIQVGDPGQVIHAGINQVLESGDKAQRLAMLGALKQAGPDAAVYNDAIEPLLNDPDEEIRSAASATLLAIDPSALERALGPPPPAMPRQTLRH